MDFDLMFKWSSRIIAVVVFLYGFWIQTVGPGVRIWAQEALGITQLGEEINNRLDQLERLQTPFRVVDWFEQWSGQSGACTVARCVYNLTGARTVNGDACGDIASVSVYLQNQNGTETLISGGSGWQFVRMGRRLTRFQISLDLPTDTPPGRYYWRAEITYKNCPGRGEPIPRNTPLWPLVVMS